VLSEIARVLKVGGQLCAREPLGTNPAFTLYRALTPKSRTVDERPFNFSDLKIIPTLFTEDRVEYFGFLSILSAFPGKTSLRGLLVAIDRVIAKTPVKYFF